MLATEIIEKKIKGQELTKEEIEYFINDYLNNKIPDYQMSALLVAIVINDMNDEETFHLTNVFINSGQVLDFKDEIIVDKHSTGGIGDKTSILLLPLLRAMDLSIAKISGRGLGFTGGTVDKLESIKGFNIELNLNQFYNLVINNKIALTGQSNELVPADKKIYALRDVTATVQSIPLMTSSIMSKKIASGAKIMILDIKCGDGSFNKDIKFAKKLATKMINIGKKFNRIVLAEITSMDQPLGNAIGNAIEIKEVVDSLKNNGPTDLISLVINSAAKLYYQKQLLLNNKIKFEDALKLAEEKLIDGSAYQEFLKWIKNQNGDISSIENDTFFHPKYSYQIKAKKDGYVDFISCKQFGELAIEIGAGRKLKNDKLDYQSGFLLNKKKGDKIKEGELLLTIYSENKINDNFVNKVEANIKIVEKIPHVEKLILEYVN